MSMCTDPGLRAEKSDVWTNQGPEGGGSQRTEIREIEMGVAVENGVVDCIESWLNREDKVERTHSEKME